MNSKAYYHEDRFLKPNKDGGDGLHRFSMCGLIDAILLTGNEWVSAQRQFNAAIDKFKVGGMFRRFYRPTVAGDWWLETGISPDQWRPLIAACGQFKLYHRLAEFEKELKARNWWATNYHKNGPERISKTMPDLAITLRGVIDRANGKKTCWVELNDRIALTEVTAKSFEAFWKRFARDHDPTNRVVLMVQSQYCLPTARTSTAEKARRTYAKIQGGSYLRRSWHGYWDRPTDPQSGVGIEWNQLIARLKD